MNSIRLLFISLLLSTLGCELFVPKVISVEGNLSPELQEQLEFIIETQFCEQIIEEGYECNVRKQMKNFKVIWHHDTGHSTTYELEFCIRDACNEL